MASIRDLLEPGVLTGLGIPSTETPAETSAAAGAIPALVDLAPVPARAPAAVVRAQEVTTRSRRVDAATAPIQPSQRARKTGPPLLSSIGPMPGTSNPTKNSSWVDKVADVHMKRMREIHGPKTGVMFDEPFATAMWRLWEQGMTRDAARGLARVVRGLRRGNRPLEAEVKHSVHQVARLARDGRVSRNDQARFATALTTLVVREVESADRKAEARRVRKAQPKVAVAAWQRERLRAMAAAQERRREVEISRASTTQQRVPAPLSRRQVQEWTRAEAEARVRLAARRARDEEAERLREESRRGAAEEFRARNPRPVSRHH